MEKIRLRKYESPSIEMEVVLLQDNLANSSLVIEGSGPFSPQVNGWDETENPVDAGYYDL